MRVASTWLGAYEISMVIFGGASAGALVKLRCPKCAHIQARARAEEGTIYSCQKCRATFTREEGTPKVEPQAAPRSRKSSSKKR
jgi:ribosomal protein L37AE/L43A